MPSPTNIPTWSDLIQFEPISSDLNQLISLFHLDLFRFNMNQFDPIWSNFIQFDPIWSNLIQFKPIWSSLIHFGRIWSNLIQNKIAIFILVVNVTTLYRNIFWLVRNPIWASLIKFDPFWTDLIQKNPKSNSHFYPFCKCDKFL